MQNLRVLHLVGSAFNDFYCGLSSRYAEYCLDNIANASLLRDYLIAYVTSDGQWRFPRFVCPEDIDVAKPMSMSEAIKFILTQNIDFVMPHMYCIPGMTHYRALFDLLKIPYLGNTPDVMAITAHKGKTKAIVAAAGVKVPFGEILRRGDVPTISLPAVVKPADADNSLGMTLVKEVTEYDAALKKAFEHSEEVIVEKFIEVGREVRCGIIVKDGELIALPLEEYRIDAHERPVRTYNDKFPELDADGNFIGWIKDDTREHWMNRPDDPITEKVHQAARKCHVALGCRHYSQFDFRIDPNGEPWFLEAGLYCAFGEGGGIAHMAKTIGIPLHEVVTIMTKEVLRKI